MRLISCYIEGYGKIKRREYTFAKGITTFCEENGEGKTTLASFIKAMFFGLKAYRKGSIEFCDREHFYPFDGGRFGGNLTFEMGGDIYKIERFFGDKSDLNDSLKVYKNGEETMALGEDLGKSVFGVDRESFERTTFLDGGEMEMKTTSGIQAKLNNFLAGTEGEEDAGGAKTALEKAAKVYKKSRVGNDKVTAVGAKILALNVDIDNATTIKRALDGKYEREKALQAEIEQVSRNVVVAQERNEKLSQFEHYDSIANEVAKASVAVEKLRAIYDKGIPDFSETESVNAYMVREKELKAKLDGMEFSSVDQDKLSLLNATFQGGVPTEAELLDAEKQIGVLADLQTESKLLESREIGERERGLRQKFSHFTPTQDELVNVSQKVEEYRMRKRACEQTPAFSTETAQRKVGGRYAFMAVVALLLCLVGGAVFFVQKLVGSAFLAVGGIFLIAVGFAYLNKKSSVQPTTVENVERRRLEEELRELEDDIKAILMPYGYYSGNGVVFDFATMQADVTEYMRFQKEEETRRETLARNRQRVAEISSALLAFFRKYGLAGDTYVKLLADLRIRCSDYADLTARKKASLQNRAKVEEELTALREKIESYQRKYGLRELSIGQILEDIREHHRLQNLVREGQAKAAAYKQEKALGERSALEKVDLQALQTKLQTLQSEKSKLDREIADDEREAERLDGYQADKAEAEALLKAYKHKHKLLSAATELIARAEGRLRDKYVKPIRQEFLRYTELIERTLGEKIVMTKDFEIRFERNGIERSEKHLSSGQRSICALCFRLALIKNMYRDRLPFLVLDDPFTSLDEVHIEKVATVLQELSKDMQMVYFTCHESRRI